MRKVFISLFVINLLVDVMSLFILPARVAIHFSLGGIPDGWASREVNALILIAMETLLFIFFLMIPRNLQKIPARWINLPARNYWLKPENRQKMQEKLTILMSEFGIGLFVFLLFISLLAIDANLSEPVILNETLFLAGFIIYMLYVIYWVFKMIRSFRLRKAGNEN